MPPKAPGERLTGFAPVAKPNASALILGSMPSAASLERGQYYGLPRNAFWKIMAELFGVAADRPYGERLAALGANGIALWDVIRSCRRPGSLDSAIETQTVEANDFAAFFAEHAGLRQVFFNGRKAEQMYRKFVLRNPGVIALPLRYATLPSTSPAHAAMSFGEKLQRWTVISRHGT